MVKLEEKFKHGGVHFEIVKRGQKAILLAAKADFYTCDSLEVWQIQTSEDCYIGENFIPARERKPSNERYPYTAHQFMRNHFDTQEAFEAKAEQRFQEYETGVRPKTQA